MSAKDGSWEVESVLLEGCIKIHRISIELCPPVDPVIESWLS